MGVINPRVKIPSHCGECPFLVYRHYDLPFGSFKDVWLKTCPYEPKDKIGGTEKYLVANRAEWCPLKKT